MGVPIAQMATVVGYILRKRLRGEKRFPLVLMLEPLYRCNLACAGCGKIQYPANVLRTQLSVEDCLRAVDQCGAPMVSIPGGEPLLHPEIDRLVRELVARKKYLYLCTNALLLEEKLPLFEPSRYLSFSVHLDGLEPEHDAAVCREGTFETAVRGIRAALARGFRVTTNTTLFDGSDPARVRAFFDEAMRLGVEGMMLSPGYAYEAAPDQQHFLARERTRELFRRIFTGGSRGWRFNQSPLFLEFLTGARDYECTPWAMPSYGLFGWQRPCYLLQEGYAKSYDELLADTAWERYGHASGNPACRDCMVHSGFEASAVFDGFGSWRGFGAMARAFLFGPRVPGAGAQDPAEAASACASAPAPRPARALAEAGGRDSWLDATPDALDAAFRFRGDVTLELADASRVEGFVSNLGEKELELWLRRSTELRRIPREAVRRLSLSGRDRAAAAQQRLASDAQRARDAVGALA
jgi:hopanoid biosynthesis associated radical SAM protein HpnH